MRKYNFIILLLIASIGVSFANSKEETVFLQIEKPTSLSLQRTSSTLVENANNLSEYSFIEKNEDQELFEPEKDVTDNEMANHFYKFVDNVIINNKFNKYSSKIENKIYEKF